MKNFRKIAFGLAAVLIAGMSVGCGEKKNEEAAANMDIKEISYYCCVPNAAASVFSDMNDLLMFQELEKRTGVHVNFTHPPAGQGSEQFSLMIATGDYPELIEGEWSTVYPGGAQKALNDGLIIKINDLMEEYAPNFTAALKSNELWDKQAKTDEGSYYGFPMLNSGDYNIFGGIIVRGDWLEELGLDTPETIDEWENVLRAFKEKKGAVPFTANGKIGQFIYAFGISDQLYVENGKVKYGPNEAAYKDYLAKMSAWYKEGLIDRDFAFNSSSAVDAKVMDNSAGVITGTVGATIGKYMNLKEEGSSFKLIAAQHPVLNKGDEPRFNAVQNAVTDPTISITNNCKNTEAAMKWIDYLYSEEGNILKNFGVEGDTFNFTEDHYPRYTDKILNNPEGRSISEAMSLYTRCNYPAPGFGNLNEYLDQYYQLDEQKEAIKIWNKYADNCKVTTLPPITPSVEESDELASLKVDIQTYVDEMTLKFIQGTESLDEYDKFSQKLKNMKIDRMLEIYQSAYDRYNER